MVVPFEVVAVEVDMDHQVGEVLQTLQAQIHLNNLITQVGIHIIIQIGLEESLMHLQLKNQRLLSQLKRQQSRWSSWPQKYTTRLTAPQYYIPQG